MNTEVQKEPKLMNWDHEFIGGGYDLKDLQTNKNNIPDALQPYKAEIANIESDSKTALWIGTLAFGTGFATLAVFGPTMSKAKELSGFGKAFLVASPALSGSLLRIPFGGNVGRTGGCYWTKILLILACVGMLLNTILAVWWMEDLETMQNFNGFYEWWLLGGLLAGCGIAVFPMIINVMFWSRKEEIGFSQAVFAGLGNSTAGISALMIAFVVAWQDLPFAYVLWLILAVAGTAVVILKIHDPPFHQLKAQGVPKEDSIKISKWLGQQMLPNVAMTLKQVSKKWQVWVLVFIYFISFGGFVALTAYLPVFNTEYHGTSGRVAGTFTASYSILASLSRTATGKHVDKIGGGKCTAMGLGCILLGSVLLGSSSPMDVHTFYQYGGLFFMGFGSGFTNAAVYKWIPKVEPTGKAQVGGLVGGVGAFGGFVLPLFLGFSKDNFTNGQARGVFTYTLFSIIGIVCTFLVIKNLEDEAAKKGVPDQKYEVVKEEE